MVIQRKKLLALLTKLFFNDIYTRLLILEVKVQRIFIIDGKRTAIGKFLGSLYEADPAQVCSELIKGLCTEKQLKEIETCIMGVAIPAGMGQGIARKIAISSGIPESVPSYSVNMVCGSGMQAIRCAVNEIKCGMNLVLCGGIEFMSNIPFCTNSYIRLGKRFGDFSMTDLLTHDGLIDSFSGVHMGITAENIAKKYSITREEQDKYSYFAQQRAIKAVDNNCFAEEIVPIHLKDYKGREYVFECDEFPNRSSTPEKIASLKPTFIKTGGGTVTAASSSGINDGAAFLLLASEEYCMKNNISPLAEIIDTSFVGCDPQYMGLGPYFAISKLLNQTKIDIENVNLFEINEAFAAQFLGCIKLLSKKYNISEESFIEKTNLLGSGLGLGHPLGATGARITVTLAHLLKSHNKQFGIASLCIGGGMGGAILLKNGN